jgi:hypothetical protein
MQCKLCRMGSQATRFVQQLDALPTETQRLVWDEVVFGLLGTLVNKTRRPS